MCRRPAAPLVLAAALAIGLGAGDAAATTFYVRTAGSDTADGLGPETAFRSIRHAGRFLLNAGDRVVVGPGEYREGNIEPRRGGSAGAPVTFLADISGALTGDPPGPVVVVPDGTRIDESTGFLVFGKHHVHIEGFTIVGAVDAGIQVRPSAQASGSSGDLTLAGNTVRQCRYGIEVRDGLRVVVRDNELSENRLGAVRLTSDGLKTNDVLAHGNRLTDGRWGFYMEGVLGARVEDNHFERLGAAVRTSGGADLVVARNVVRQVSAALRLGGTAGVVIEENAIDDCGSAVRGGGSGVAFVRNRVAGIRGGSLLPSGGFGEVIVEGNEFLESRSTTKIHGAAIVIRDNVFSAHLRLEVSASLRVEIIGNQVEGEGRLIRAGATQVAVVDNRVDALWGMRLHGGSILVDANRLGGLVGGILIEAFDAVATDNEIDGSGAEFRHRVRMAAGGASVFLRNRIGAGGGIVVNDRVGATDVEALDNRIVGAREAGIAVTSGGSARIERNEILQPIGGGIMVALDRATSAARIEDNVVTGGAAGIEVTGARTVAIRGNLLGDPKGRGIAVRSGDIVDVARNEVIGAGSEAIAVGDDAIMRGDCSRDGRVTASEIRRGIHRLFDDDVAADCSALGPNRHGRIQVNQLQRALGAHLTDSFGRMPSTAIDVADNRAESSGGGGIILYASRDLTARRNVVRGSAETGISATAGPFARVVLEDNSVEDSGNDCILVSGGSVGRVAGTSALACRESGLRIRDTATVTVERTALRSAAEAGLFATRIQRWVSRGNTVADSRGGIALRGGRWASPGLPSYRLAALLQDDRIERSDGVGLLLTEAREASAVGLSVLQSAQHGVAVRGAGELQLVENDILGAAGAGISIGGLELPGADDVVVDRNLIQDVGSAAVDVHASGSVLLARNDVAGGTLGGGAALSVRYDPDAGGVTVVSGNRVRGGVGDGVFVQGAVRAYVWDNVIVSALAHGVSVRTTAATEVVNSLVYDNAGHGIHFDRPGMARVFNNTLYANDGWALASEGATTMAILNNIFDANGEGSVALAPGDAAVVNEGFNLTTGPYAGLEPAETDLFEDPRFVDPAGRDGELGGDAAADDDFRLRLDSPAIDAGANTAEYFGISGSATEDGGRDTGAVDLGFHYGASPRVP